MHEITPQEIQFARYQLAAWQAYRINYSDSELLALRTVASVIADEPQQVSTSTYQLFAVLKTAERAAA